MVSDGLTPALRTAIVRAPAPQAVDAAIRRLVERDPDLLERLDGDGRLRDALVMVTAASRSLTRLLESDPEALDVLADLDRPVPVGGGDVTELVRGKRRELLRIAARDLIGADDLRATTAALSRLATDVLATALALVGAEGLAVIGMGKLGGNELNYASDVDLLLVGDGRPEDLERQARELIEVAGHCFRIDLNLRPEGRSGALVRSVDSYEAYWDRWAQPWEFQALLKARPVAGDTQVGARFHDAAQRWLWNRPFDADALRSLRSMKERSESEVARRGLADRDVKQGRGGIRDIEFAVQLLQLVHGQHDADLREPNTLDALHELASAGYIDRNDGDELREAYVFLRRVEHHVQLVDEQQVHVVPEDRRARETLARVLGFRATRHGDAVDALDQRLVEEQLSVRLIHERIYFRPLLEAFSGSDGALTPQAATTRLAAFGFTDAKRTQAAVRELTRGLNRSSRLMQQLLPLLLDWLSQSPDPDLGLLMLRNLLSGAPRQAQLIEAFRESPEVARRLCLILGTSRLLGDILFRNPDVIPRLADEQRLLTLPKDELVERGRTAISWRPDLADRQVALQRWQQRHLLGIAARDVFDVADVHRVGDDLCTLAEAALQVALESIQSAVPIAVVALGRFGGGQLSYSSDLDIVLVHGGHPVRDADAAERASRELLRFVGGPTPAERIYEIDTQLRPEGRHGSLVRTVDGYVTYFERWAQVWERQAFTRARVVAGDEGVGAELLARLEPLVWDPGLSDADRREIRRMKARIENERIPVGEDPAFHLKLGRGSLSDIEWTAQYLQLQHGVKAAGTIAALRELQRRDLLDDDDAAVLIEAYEFLERTRNRLFLVVSAPADSLPSQPEPLSWLARSLDTTPSELRDRYRRVTRRARRVFERIFYGKSP